jgi:hypothetical protein
MVSITKVTASPSSSFNSFNAPPCFNLTPSSKISYITAGLYFYQALQILLLSNWAMLNACQFVIPNTTSAENNFTRIPVF